MRTASLARQLSSLLLALCLLLAGCKGRSPAELPPDDGASEVMPEATLDPNDSGSFVPAVVEDIPAALAELQRAELDNDPRRSVELYYGLLKLPEVPERAELQIRLARTLLELDEPLLALAQVLPLARADPPLPQSGLAYGLAGRAYDLQGARESAISAYRNYLRLVPAVEPDIRWHIGQILSNIGDYRGALAEYDAVAPELFNDSQRASLLEEKASLRQLNGDLQGALALYDEILSFAQQPTYQALVLYWKGTALMSSDQATGIELLKQAYQRSPNSYAAYLVMGMLEGSEHQFLSQLQQSRICYDNALYERSAELLSSYLAGNSATAESLLLSGLLAEKQALLPEALGYLEQAIQLDSLGPFASEARFARARVLAANGESPSEAYREIVALTPAWPRAAEALWLSALYQQARGDWPQAQQDYLAIMQNYPQSEYGADAGFRAGLVAYAATDVSRAEIIWDNLNSAAPADPKVRVRLLYWLGVATMRLGDMQRASDYWQQAAALSPDSYYGLRAYDQLNGRDLLIANQPQLALIGQPISDAEFEAMDAWLAADPRTAADPTDPAADANYQRAAALWELGWPLASMAAYRHYGEQTKASPRSLLRAVRLTESIGAYPASIALGEILTAAVVAQGHSDIPELLWRVENPEPYREQVAASVELHGGDELLLEALLKQESAFRPGVASSAGAVGLAQIMPGTAEQIATRLGETYDPQALLRSGTSIRYGAFYLNQALANFNGAIMPALSAYNAGTGATLTWLQTMQFTDDDLFFELVPYAETRAYLRLVYRNYRLYQHYHSAQTTTSATERRRLSAGWQLENEGGAGAVG
ncbi:MAG: transglycosylase SLT domain-containing protein [Chloroflexi bacterium]|nr:transglycosylase SLT domain-containing protein [Chloroflexota bacterium]